MGRRRLTVGFAIASAIALAGLSACRGSPGTTVVVNVSSTPVSRPVAPGFVGLSLEYWALPAYAGSDPSALNPLFIALIRRLAAGQSPVIRIGGDSTDSTWWPVAGAVVPARVTYALTPSWLRIGHALAATLGAKLVLGLNMAADSPAVAAAEARAFERGIGGRFIQALELGNEPDLYGRKPGYGPGQPSPMLARPAWYDLASYLAEFARLRQALTGDPVAGPAFAWLSWMGGLRRFLAAEPGLALVTFHRYPLHGCDYPASSPLYASVPRLLSDSASAGLAQPITAYAVLAHASGVPLRIDELNSASCSGKPGVSNSFAAALWGLAALFDFARAGVDGVNVHTFPGAGYQLFSFRFLGGRWHASVSPEFEGLELFADAAPPGSRLLDTTSTAGAVRAWATQAPDGTVRVVLVNDDLRSAQMAELAGLPLTSAGTIERLLAPSATATSGARLTQPRLTLASADRYTVMLPAASAALLTMLPGLTAAPPSP